MDTETSARVERTAGAPLPAHPGLDDAPAKPAVTGRVNRWVLLVLGIAILGGGALFLKQKRAATSAAASGPAPERVVPVTVASVVKKDVQIWLEGLGTATPLATVNVKTLVDGPLISVNFKEGQLIHKGDLLAQIDPRPYQNALHNAQAALSRDTAQLRDARVNLERYRSLRAQNLIAQQQLDTQQALAEQYEATTQADQAQIDAARLNLDYARIVSPIEGVTGVRLIDVGNIVHASDQTYMVVLTQLDPMAVLFTLPEDDLPRVQREMNAGPIACEAYSRDGLTKLATGTLGLIDNEVNQTTATIRLKAFFPNKDRSLWPNEFVKARLLLSTKTGALVVPGTVVQRGPKGTFAYVVNADSTVAVQAIEVASTQGDEAVVTKGLEPGQRVVVDGQNQLKPGSKIEPRTVDVKPVGGTPPGDVPPAPAGSGSAAPRPSGGATP